MSDTRRKDVNWRLNELPSGNAPTDDAQLAVLMDIRDELKRLNSVLHCTNFLAIPSKLDAIRRNTAKKRRKKQ
jgi:hypothetical protein